ncbi:MAG: phage tail sheath family protein, partial [Bacteroidetes bacterium]|nr:phage tail sheath family protein [Bacteroidota bacterium]
DLASILMLGSNMGGIEKSRYSSLRPAANGFVFNLGNLNTFADLDQGDFNRLLINGKPIQIGDKLKTSSNLNNTKMYHDGMDASPSGGFDGIREKMAIIAEVINDYGINKPDFPWKARVSGQRIIISFKQDGDNKVLKSFATDNGAPGSGVDLGNNGLFLPNVEYYSLGKTGNGSFQDPGEAGSDGNSPTLKDYRNAFDLVESEVDLFNLLILPIDTGHNDTIVKSLWGAGSSFCESQRAFLLIDPLPNWKNVQQAVHPTTGVNRLRVGLVKGHSAIFYPRLKILENGMTRNVGTSGAIAGLMSRIDSKRNVWKAPAGVEATIRDVVGLEYLFSDRENGVLNPKGINALRLFPDGIVNWGGRTMAGDDSFASEWKYISVRRTALFIEESLYRGTKWVVFEPNDEPLWSQIRLNVGSFMRNLFRQGAFQGKTPKEAYFVKCDNETTTQNDINNGIVNILVGFAPLKPAEFVILKLQQMTGQVLT